METGDSIGRRDEAIESHERALEIYRQSGHPPGGERELAAIERLRKGKE